MKSKYHKKIKTDKKNLTNNLPIISCLLNYEHVNNGQDMINLFAKYFSNVYTDQSISLFNTSKIQKFSLA